MIERLQTLPLLLGLGREELLRIAECMELDFRKCKPRSVLARQGERAKEAVYLLRGSMTAERRFDDTGLRMTEQVDDNPWLIEPENLWGRKQTYLRTYTLLTEGSLLIMRKQQIHRLATEYDAVMANLLSLVCTRLSRAADYAAQPLPDTVDERLLNFLKANALTPTGEKTLLGTMPQIATQIATTRLNVSTTLHRWEDEGRAQLGHKSIVINL